MTTDTPNDAPEQDNGESFFDVVSKYADTTTAEGGEGIRHAVERTSPKGTAFYGTCIRCGLMNLTIGEAMTGDCANLTNISDDDAMMALIRPASQEFPT